ncbi:helicase domino-like isoform X2 [Babylonia areolata]|uniref:helicase domino-like isoform X2 n=1 Tax=Babylonia areolata TaxID=304850 RepID=UPI003FD53A0E
MQHNDGAQQQEGRISTTSSSIAALSAITTSHPAVSQLRVTGRVPVVTAAPTIGVVAAGQQGVLTTVAGARPVAMSPQAVMVPTQTVSRLLSPSTSLSANTVQIPATLNVLQRQLSAPGVVGLSAVSAQDLQQVLQQATQQSITLLTATEAVGEPQQRPRLARPLSFPHSSPTLPAVSSMSATGATIHHHGQSPVRGAVPVMAATLSHSNLQHSLLGMNLNPQQQQQLSSTQRRVVTTAAATTTTSAIAVIPAANITAQSRTVLEVRAPSGQPPSLRTASGAPPRKKMRLEEKQPPNAEVANYRKQLIELKHKQMKELKSEYFENLTEMFFLQNGQNLMDYHTWKKRPTPQLVSFLTSGKLDSDEEEDVLQVKEINSEVKVLTNPGSNVPLATPVAISTTLPPMVSALSQQGSEHRSSHRPVCLPGFSHSLSAAFSVVAPSAQTASAGTTTTTLSATASQAIASSSALSSPSTAGTAAATSTSQLQQQLSKTQDPKAAAVKGQLASFKQVKSPPLSPNQRLHTRQQSLSAVYDNISGSSQEVIVERAKQEAEVVQRVAELRKEGLWSSKRLPRVQEPPRQKAHWDYLLEEMTWLAADFIQERKWKKAAARKVARMVSNYFKEQEQKELKAEKEEATKLKKIASHMAKMVKEFWTNIEKVVQYKQQMRLDEKKKRALDLHLNFIVDQTEKYSTWLTEGLQAASSVNGSVSTSPSHSSDGADFEPSENSTDDEETIQKEEDEAEGNEADEQQELEDLQKEGDLPLDELLKTLPQEVLDAPAPLPPPLPEGMEDLDSDDDEVEEEEEKKEEDLQKEEKGGEEGSKAEGDKGSSEQHEGSDKEFTGAEEEAVDVEDTIDEQEKHEKRDYQSELQDLADEGEMSIEELAAKYAGAYDSDFEMPQESSSEEEEESDSDLDSDQFEIESGSSSEQEQKEEEVETEKVKEESPGLEDLLKPQQAPEPTAPSTSTAAPQPEVKKEEKEEVINDIAAQALSLQPKGYTLETTEVRTKVPFLLKHKLREYQHVGLDWLATMHDKHLNGILADEMGLGKTIQTIALLAHLACEKGTWGPHLIVVPTSVMLNWEMELKKWCPSFKILTYYGNQKERKLKRQGWTKTNAFHVCITSYKLVVQDHQAFRRKKWKYLILDEAQNIKNFKSQRWQMLLNFSSQRRLLLTGTPLQNSLMELWSLMHFLMPNVFQSHRDFKEWFSNPLTGMIEGSQEYNESLIKRLHKVLRPFLLRRLKNEVEKQMPQKYEHVVMCRLSKRQRFLYDDFMSQAKTKETLASGHYMSVINILMQLRKVCNHPNLFDPRPVVSPLIMQGLTFSTASIVTTALHKDPLEEVDMQTLFPNLAEMERDLPAFVAHRVKQLKTAPGLIEEVDYHPDPPPPLPKGRLKTGTFPLSSALLQTSARASSPVTAGRAGSPVEVVKAAVSRSATPPVPTVSASVSSQSAVQSTPAGSATSAAALSSGAVATISQVRPSSGQTLLLTSAARSGSSSALVLTTSPSMAIATAASAPTTPTVSSTLTSTLQAKVLPQPSSGSSSSGSTAVLSTQPITVQIQQTNQGTRLMIPTGQLSQLPANLFQIVQTSSGQHLVATSTPTSSFSAQVSAVLPVTSAASNTVNGPSTLTTVAATSGQGLVTTAVSQLKTLTALATTASTTVLSAVAPASSSTSSSAPPTCSVASSVTVSSASSKPVMRVSPMVASTSSGTVTVISTTTTTTTSTSSALPASVVSSVVSTLKSVMSPKKRSELFSEIVYERRKRRRREKLKRLARVNGHHCTHTPVYGPDLVQTLTLSSDLCSQCHREKHWLRAGHANCQCVHSHHNRNLPKYYWHETSHLSDLIRTPEQYLTELRDVLDRFAFCIPSVISPGVQLRVAHPDPSLVLQERRLELDVREQLRPTATRLNDLRMRMSMHFPELRLIQYDCGKLQTLDVLLRDLKSGGHRVLIFTQMTKMLDVLEAFLNYHGHRYLRLDGTTKVEQRQALMDRFNADRRIFCFILSTRSGGIGVNLTGADTVVFYDSDWNPTMDAQAQDRCHRIGQTRDVHIYRLISEMTVEENILKKANQKRLLGDLAIEGGNFTTAFFKEQTIKDLFAQPSGLKSLTEEKEKETEERKEGQEESMEVEEVPAVPTPSRKPGGKDKDASIVAAFEQALCKAEDETDAIAASLVKAEQKAELADFDESIPWDEKEAEARKEEDEMSRAELELAMLDKELTGIERYAVSMMETQMEDEVMEELKMAEEDIENSKKDWELTRLKALKEEEERRAKMEEDEMLYTYLRDDCQVFINALDGLEMPLWAPPTPPQDDNDVYVDQTMLFLHEGSIMSESQLPPVYVRKDHRKPRIETITTRKQKQRKEEAPRVPRSLFDRPSSALVKMRRELKMQRLKAAGLGLQHKQPMRPTSLPAPLSHKAPMVEQSEGHPEWLIHEDWALLQAVSDCCHLPLNLTGYQNGHIPNWDLVADVVNGVSRTHRSIKQCRARYENVIIPREEGRILYDVSPRKHKKNKATYKTKNNRPMKTSQLFTQDNYSSISLLYSLRFDSVKSMAGKRPAPMRQTLNNPTMKNPKHLVVLQDNHINYDQPLNPIQVAAIRAERIQREKKASSAANANAEAAQRPAQPSGTVGERGAQGVVQAVGGVAASAPTVAQAVAGHQLQSLVSAATPTTIIAGAATPRAAVAQGMPVSIARTLAASGNIVAVTGSLGRGRVQVHDITTVAGTVTGAQVAAQTARAATLQPTASASANITQKMAAMAASTSALAGGTVHQQIPKGLNQQINLLHPIMRSQTPGTATQAQQLGHKVRFTKQAVVRMPGITDEQLKALKVRQIPNKAQGGQQVKLQAAQILQGQVQQVGQSGTTSAAPVTLVKSVPAPAGASAIPVSINVTMAQGQQKTAQASRGPTVSQLQHHQRMQLLQQRKGVPLQQPHRVTALPSGVRSGQQIPLIVPSKTGQLTGQLLHQYIKQPAIISVTQASMVAKVSLPHSTPIHTLSAAAAGSPITVTQVAAAATGSAGGSGAPSHHAPTVATINMANVSAATHATVVKAATLATVDGGGVPKMATLAQSLVTPPPLQITSTALQPAQSATLVGPGGTQHRVLTATPTTLPQATAVVVPTTTLAQSAAAATTTVVQQQQQSAQQMVNAAAVVSAQAVASPGAMATVVTQTQSPQAPPSSQPSAQLTAQQQQQLQKVSPYAMRTRNQPKHS